MKSRIKKESPLLIGYMIKENKIEVLSKIAYAVKATLKLYSRESAGEKNWISCRFYLDLKNLVKIPQSINEDECLIISGFNNKSIDKLLYELRLNNITFPLKCIVTQHNQSWTLNNLLKN